MIRRISSRRNIISVPDYAVKNLKHFR